MIRWRDGVVTAVRREWPGAVELDVAVPGEDDCRALAYPALTGRPELGDRVLLNTTALALGLGTGGYAFVVAIPDRLPHHEVLRDADDLGGMPVVIADLHSALPAVLAGTRSAAPPGRAVPPPSTATPSSLAAAATGAAPPRAVYVMQDGGALPAWFSRTCAGLREAGWLAGTVTTGQAFGGDLEAVTLHTGLLAARHVLGADLAVVTQGPGNVGTGTRWGFSGVACGEAVNAAAVLGGRPVAALRVSEADARDRHRGVSHHSLTAYGRVALARADVVVPELPGEFGARVTDQAAELGQRHHLVRVALDGLHEALRACPVPLSTMGRGLDQDLAYFLAAAASGKHALSLL